MPHIEIDHATDTATLPNGKQVPHWDWYAFREGAAAEGYSVGDVALRCDRGICAYFALALALDPRAAGTEEYRRVSEGLPPAGPWPGAEA